MQCTPKEIEEKRRQAQLKLLKKNSNRNSPKQINLAGVNSITDRNSLTNPNRINSSLKSINLFNSKPYDKPQSSTSFYGASTVVTGVCSLISEDRFKVELSSFSQPAIEVFKTIPSRLYNSQTKLWSFHVNDYGLFQSKMKSLQPDVVVSKLPAYVLNCCKMKEPDYSTIDLSTIDEELAGALMPFQEKGVCFGIHKNGRCLIADDMGLGKTFQALGIASFYKANWPLLIATTSSMKNVWEETIHQYLPSVSLMHTQYMVSGKDYIGDALILIVSHEMMSRCLNKLLERRFGVLIVDESHTLKNFRAKCTIAATQLAKQATRVILLSGTPALSRPSELYTQLSIIDESFFGNFFDYSKRYCDAKSTNFGWDASGKSNLQELEVILKKHFMIRRTKDDVLKMLPNKEQEVVKLDVNLDSLSEEDRLCLNSLANRYNSKKKGTEKHAALLNFFSETARIKIPSVCSYILQILETMQKFIVFAHHIKMLDAIEHVLVKKKRKFIRIDGNTNSNQRKALVDKFQLDDSCECAILSITAASAGITLTAAKLVLFAELHWNPSIISQAESRAHRIGQDGKVLVRYLLASGTADDYIWPLLQEKQKILKEVGLFKESFENISTVAQTSSNLESLTNDLNLTFTTSQNTLDISSYFKSPNKSSAIKRRMSDTDNADDFKNQSVTTKRHLSDSNKVEDCKSIPNSQDSFFDICCAQLDFLDDGFDDLLSKVEVSE